MNDKQNEKCMRAMQHYKTSNLSHIDFMYLKFCVICSKAEACTILLLSDVDGEQFDLQKCDLVTKLFGDSCQYVVYAKLCVIFGH